MKATDISSSSSAIAISESSSASESLQATTSSFEHILHPIHVKFFSQENPLYQKFPLDEKHLSSFQKSCGVDPDDVIAFGVPGKHGTSITDRRKFTSQNISPGTLFSSRHDLLVSGIHQQTQSGVHHRDGKVFSLLLADYNEGQVSENGDSVEYEFCGGRNSETGHEDLNSAANRAIMEALKYGNG